jgi:hypothetical protein
MRNIKDNDLAGRRSAAADAKSARLQAHRAAKAADEPSRVARQQERVLVAAAKDEREAERARLKLEEQAIARAEMALDLSATKFDALPPAETRGTGEETPAPSAVADEATQKAERDRRYAERKARKR